MAVWYHCTLVTVLKRIRTFNKMVHLYQGNLLYWLFQPGVNLTRNTLRHKKNDFRQLTWGTGRVRLGGKAEDAKGLNCENWLLTLRKKIIRNVTEFVRQRIKKRIWIFLGSNADVVSLAVILNVSRKTAVRHDMIETLFWPRSKIPSND